MSRSLMSWSLLIDFGLIGAALIAATAARARMRVLQRFLIPNALTAGVLLFPLYNWVAPLLGHGSGGVEQLTYHLLNVAIIALGLRSTTGRRARAITGSAVVILAQMTLQGLAGFLLTFALIWTLLPELFPSFGLLTAIGFSLGPGQAFAIGSGWEALGFEGAGSIGLTFGAVGFLLACVGGVLLINTAIRRGWIERPADYGRRTGVLGAQAAAPAGARLRTESDAIDSLSLWLAVVFGVYLASYGLLVGLTELLALIGPAGERMAANLWGIAFIFGLLVALAARALAERLGVAHLLDGAGLTRIAGGAVDFMIAAGLASIAIGVIAEYWLLLVVFALLIGALTLACLLWITPRLFDDHPFERLLMFYGSLTGTITTGIALVRVVDPELRTPAAADYCYASGLTFFLAIPLILILNLPADAAAAIAAGTGTTAGYWLAAAVMLAYALALAVAFRMLARRRGWKRSGSAWNTGSEKLRQEV